jgi:hypothetical protein
MDIFLGVLIGVLIGLLFSKFFDIELVTVRHFSLRSLFVVTTVVALLLGTVAALRLW